MEIRQLRYFTAVARAGSMSRGAERSHIAQPTLSQQIRKLETELGTPLFDRLGRGVALTDAGRALLPRAERILNDLHAIETELDADVDAGAGRFAIGAIPTMAPFVLPPTLAAIRKSLPRCELLVHEDFTENLVEQVVDNHIDAAIVSTPIDHDQIDLEVLGREKLIVVSPATGPLDHGGNLSLADLRDVPRVSLHEMHCLGQQIAGFCSLRSVGANIVCHATQLATLLELVRMGLGVSLVPEMAARHARSDARLRFAELSRQGPTREIALITRTGRTQGAAVALTRDVVRAQVSSES